MMSLFTPPLFVQEFPHSALYPLRVNLHNIGVSFDIFNGGGPTTTRAKNWREVHCPAHVLGRDE